MSENYDLKEDSLDKMSPLLDDNQETKKSKTLDNNNENRSNTSNSSNSQVDLNLENQNNKLEIIEDFYDKINDFEKKSDFLFIEKIKKNKDINFKNDLKKKSKSVKKENYNHKKKKNNQINKETIKTEQKDIVNINVTTPKGEEFDSLSKEFSTEVNKDINNNSKDNLNKEINKNELLKNEDKLNNTKIDNKIEEKKKKSSNNINDITINNSLTKEYFGKEDFEYQTIGFNNIGNTCYMNSFLQILLHTPNFLKELIKINEERNLNNNLINNLISLAEDPKNTGFLRNIKILMGKVDNSFSDFCQNDSQEFGISLLDEIINGIKGNQSFSDENISKYEITPENQKEYTIKLFEEYKSKFCKEELSLEKMFQIHETFIKIELEKGIQKIKHIDFNTSFNIELSFPNNQKNKNFDLIELLESKYGYYISKEKTSSEDIDLEVRTKRNNNKSYDEIQLREQKSLETNKSENKFSFLGMLKNMFFSIINFFKYCFCTNQNENNEEKNKINQSKKKNYEYISKLASLPKILIISINRAIFRKGLYDNLLKYEDILDVSKFIDKNINNTNKSIEYKLYAINECSGRSVNSGHYYSFIKIKEKWYKFNDSTATEQTPNFASTNVVGLYYIKSN